MASSLTLWLAAALSAASPLPGDEPHHALTSASAAGLRLPALIRAEAEVEAELNRGAFPGAGLAIGRRGHVVVERGMGRVAWGPAAETVDPDRTLYDLASLTKVVGTSTAIMLLVEDGRMALDDRIGRFLPEWRDGLKAHVTVRHLLTHTSGLPAGADLWAPTAEDALARAILVPLRNSPGLRVEYSDIGFVVLWAAAERAAGEPLHRLLDRRVYAPLGMTSTTFRPGPNCAACAPTSTSTGLVHDPIARRLGGIAGNAGLFSTLHDVSRFTAMLANGGELDGVRVLEESTVRLFSEKVQGAKSRTLGWDTSEPDPGCWGHTGYTGTSIWINTSNGSWTVLLTNRVFEPKASNRIQIVRRALRQSVSLATGSDLI